MKHNLWPQSVLLLLLAACTTTSSTPDAGQPPVATWHAALEGEAVGGALLSVWGASPTDVWAVGGTLGNGGENVVLRYDGTRLTRVSPGGTHTWWWVAGSAANNVWMVGESGHATRWDGSAFVAHDVPLNVTLWGVWTDAPDNVWVVGGTPGGGAGRPNDVVFHWDGSAWTQETLPGVPRNASLFKVWGTSSTDLYAVGEFGTIWHREGTTWTLESATYAPPLATGTLFTVWGCDAANVFAVGGSAILHRTAAGWAKTSATMAGGANGVTCANNVVQVVGFGGLKLRGEGETWTDQSFASPFGDMHASWADGAGNIWAVGGDWLSPARNGVVRDGLLARYSVTAPPLAISP
jgi:hypothetical protein